MKRLLSVLTCVGAVFAPQARAGIANDIPSCYAASRMTVAAPASETEVFILIDQTTPLDDALQSSVLENAGRLVKPGNSFVVGSFSSFNQGHYLQVDTAGKLEATIAPGLRDDISVKLLRGFDECLRDQAAFGRRAAADAIRKALAGSSVDFAKSDIMGSLKELSSRVRQSTAREKILFLVSDMLEYSGVSSFYANRNVRAIDPVVEMKKAEQAQVIGDFGGARVFVLGGGLVQSDAGGRNRDSGVYRDPRTIGQLRQFWTAYFNASHAKLVEFGAPALVVPVQ